VTDNLPPARDALESQPFDAFVDGRRSPRRAASKPAWLMVPIGMHGFPASSTPMRMYPAGGQLDIATTALTNFNLAAVEPRSRSALKSSCDPSGNVRSSTSFS